MKKRYQLTLTKENMEELQALLKSAGIAPNWLSNEIDRMLPGLITVVKQAIEDAHQRMQLTEEEAKDRYTAIMSAACEVTEGKKE